MLQLQVMWIWLKWLIGLVAIGLLIFLGLKLYQSDSQATLSSKHALSSTAVRIDWVMHHGTIKITNDQGQQIAAIHSLYSQHYPQTDITELTHLTGILQNQQNDQWHIQADKGYIDQNHNNRLLLYGHVIVHRQANANQSGLTLLTRALNYNPQTHQACTHLPVVITKPHATLHAQGFQANLKKNQIHFFHDTEIEYPHYDQSQTKTHSLSA